jgi:hypothetical protein
MPIFRADAEAVPHCVRVALSELLLSGVTTLADLSMEPLINSTIPSVFHGHGDPGLISANIDGFTPYFRGRNPRPGRLQTQFTCQA